MASELYNTIDALSREKGIDPQIVVNAVEDAIVVATRFDPERKAKRRREIFPHDCEKAYAMGVRFAKALMNR